MLLFHFHCQSWFCGRFVESSLKFIDQSPRSSCMTYIWSPEKQSNSNFLYEIVEDHETVDLMMQSFHWVVFSRTSIFLTVRLRAISTWYLVIALWTVVLLQLIRTEITHWVALLCTLLFEYLKMTVFYPFLMYKNLLKTVLQNNFVDSKLFRTLCYSVSNLRMM